jgi:hypothetical protein
LPRDGSARRPRSVLLSESRRLDAALGSACTYIVPRSPLKVVQSEQRPVLIQRRVADVGDGRSACARRWRQAPAHCHTISVRGQCCGSLVWDDPDLASQAASAPTHYVPGGTWRCANRDARGGNAIDRKGTETIPRRGVPPVAQLVVPSSRPAGGSPRAGALTIRPSIVQNVSWTQRCESRPPQCRIY